MENITEKIGESERVLVTSGAQWKQNFFCPREIAVCRTSEPVTFEGAGAEDFVMLFVNKGAGTLEYENLSYPLGAGNVCFLCGNLPHKIFCGERFEYLKLLFGGPGAKEYYARYRAASAPAATPRNRAGFEKILRELLEINRFPSEAGAFRSAKLIVDLLTELCMLAVPENFDKIPEHLLAIREDIDANFSAELSLEEYSERFACNKFQLSKEFKKYFGINFKEYLINRRLGYAKRLLEESDEAVYDISLLAGFENISHFISLFKNRETVTPLCYRKQRKSSN